MLAASGLDRVAANTAPSGAVARIAGLFDCTAAWLNAENMLGDDMLDLGCGIGRVAAAIAPHVRSVLGTDTPIAMVVGARRRYAGVANIRFEHIASLGLDAPSASLDLVLAVDSFPYLVQAGSDIADRHVADAALPLRPSGRIVLLNLSYWADPVADAGDAHRWAAQHRLPLDHAGTRPFTLWDGAAWVLRLERPISPFTVPAR